MSYIRFQAGAGIKPLANTAIATQPRPKSIPKPKPKPKP
jgi:hypothetical protein